MKIPTILTNERSLSGVKDTPKQYPETSSEINYIHTYKSMRGSKGRVHRCTCTILHKVIVDLNVTLNWRI